MPSSPLRSFRERRMPGAEVERSGFTTDKTTLDMESYEDHQLNPWDDGQEHRDTYSLWPFEYLQSIFAWCVWV